MLGPLRVHSMLPWYQNGFIGVLSGPTTLSCGIAAAARNDAAFAVCAQIISPGEAYCRLLYIVSYKAGEPYASAICCAAISRGVATLLPPVTAC